MAAQALALGVQLDEPVGQVLGRGLGLAGGLGPLVAGELVELHPLGVIPTADILADQVQ